MMFALWRTCQHFAEPHSLPDAQSASQEKLLAAAEQLPTMGRAGQYAARETEKGWSGIGFVKHGALRTTTPNQLTTYDLCRMGLKPFSNDKYRTLTPADHPQRTVDLDL